MKRRLFSILSALSLLLFVAVAALWVRSHRIPDELHLHHSGGVVGLHSSEGQVLLSRESSNDARFPERLEVRLRHPRKDRLDRLREETEETEWMVHWDWAGFTLATQEPAHYYYQFLFLPLWLPFLMAAVLPALWLALFVRRARRRHRDLCPRCGYDLRASSDRCPECGEAIPAAPNDPPPAAT